MAKRNKILINFSSKKYLVVIILFLLIFINIFGVVFKKDQKTFLKSQIISRSKGDSYNAVLNFWISMIKNQDWDNASKIQKFISKEDIQKYTQIYHPIFLELRAQYISQKKEITIEDYMELSKIYISLSQYQNATDALLKARQVDLFRTDIERLSLLF